MYKGVWHYVRDEGQLILASETNLLLETTFHIRHDLTEQEMIICVLPIAIVELKWVFFSVIFLVKIKNDVWDMRKKKVDVHILSHSLTSSYVSRQNVGHQKKKRRKENEEEFVVLSLLPKDDSSKLIVHSSSVT